MGEAGTLTVVVDDRLAWPYRLVGAAVAVDGEIQYLLRSGEVDRVLATVRAVDGNQTIAVRVDVAYPRDAVGDDCRVLLNASKTVAVAPAGGTMQVVVSLRDVSYDFADRPKIDFEFRGVTLRDEVRSVPIRTRPDSCPPLSDATDGIRGAEERIRQAREAGDLIALACYAEKLAGMRALANLLEGWRRTGTARGSAEEAEHHRRLVAVAEERIELLRAEIESCDCAVDDFAEVFASGPERRVVGEGCRSDDVLAPDAIDR